MSSIYDNTFVIGNTSAVIYQSGPGISITQPSVGTIRIAKDETVLWSGNSTSEITLSEDSNNFERVRVLYRINDGICGSSEVIPASSGVKVGMSTNAFYSDKVRLKGNFSTLSGNKLTPNAVSTNITAPTGGSVSVTTETNVISTLEVIGINRIAGGN